MRLRVHTATVTAGVEARPLGDGTSRDSGSRRDGNRTILTFEVRDDHSAVQKAEFSLDGERWQNIYPRDGIADSRMERYELVLEGNQAARAVIIRVTDALNNVTSARGEAPAPASR